MSEPEQRRVVVRRELGLLLERRLVIDRVARPRAAPDREVTSRGKTVEHAEMQVLPRRRGEEPLLVSPDREPFRDQRPQQPSHHLTRPIRHPTSYHEGISRLGTSGEA